MRFITTAVILLVASLSVSATLEGKPFVFVNPLITTDGFYLPQSARAVQ